MRGRDLFTPFISTTLALLSAGCQTGPAAPERVAGAAQAVVRGAVQGLSPSSVEAATVALVWTYWDPADCEVTVDGLGYESRGCSGSTLATTATLDPGTNGFVITQAEPPPSFVHGFDTEVAEAVIALLPEGDLGAYDVRSGVPSMRGVSRDHMIVYVPSDLAAERFEAQSLGGAALGRGFHLVRALDEGPQIEGTVGPLAGCPSGDVCTMYTRQAGELADPGEEVVIHAGDPDAPALFL